MRKVSDPTKINHRQSSYIFNPLSEIHVEIESWIPVMELTENLILKGKLILPLSHCSVTLTVIITIKDDDSWESFVFHTDNFLI